MVQFLLALVPSAGILVLFWFVVKGLVEADRRERLAQARLDAVEVRPQTPPRPARDSPGAGR